MDDKEPQDSAVTAGSPLPADSTELRKPHEMIVMLPRAKRVTLTGRRLYNALLHVSQSRLAAMQSMPSADYMFEAPMPALLRKTGSTGEDRTAAKRYLREMRGLEVDWESTAPGDGMKWRAFSMLSEVAIEIRNGENWVSWSFPPTIMSALREPTRWARIDLGVLAKLGSYSALALYEICARYRDNPSGLTSRKPVQWWADALSQSPAASERREWRKVKSERVKEAVDEINRETDLEVELIEHKEGRAVIEVQFAVRRKKQAPAVPKGGTETDPVDANLVLRAESLGVREIKLEALIRDFGEDKVRVAVDALEKRAANQMLRRIENSYSYLRSLLRDGSGGAGEIEGDVQSALPTVRTPAPAGQQLPSFENPDAVWRNERIGEIKAELAAMDPAHRQEWINRAVDDLRERHLLSGVLQRRAAQGDWAHGLLGAHVVRLYAVATHGTNWDKAPDLAQQA